MCEDRGELSSARFAADDFCRHPAHIFGKNALQNKVSRLCAAIWRMNAGCVIVDDGDGFCEGEFG